LRNYVGGTAGAAEISGNDELFRKRSGTHSSSPKLTHNRISPNFSVDADTEVIALLAIMPTEYAMLETAETAE